MNENLRQTFFATAKKDEKKVVQAFVATNSEGALKTKPKARNILWQVIPNADRVTRVSMQTTKT
jgi:hypothetical protein